MRMKTGFIRSQFSRNHADVSDPTFGIGDSSRRTSGLDIDSNTRVQRFKAASQLRCKRRNGARSGEYNSVFWAVTFCRQRRQSKKQ